MNFFISHIYREGNKCTDTMANIGLSLPISSAHTWWSSSPPPLFIDLDCNRLGWPCRPLFSGSVSCLASFLCLKKILINVYNDYSLCPTINKYNLIKISKEEGLYCFAFKRIMYDFQSRSMNGEVGI
jgi:hypothetical protein